MAITATCTILTDDTFGAATARLLSGTAIRILEQGTIPTYSTDNVVGIDHEDNTIGIGYDDNVVGIDYEDNVINGS